MIGLVASIAIWVLTPYNNFVLLGSFISDSYLPIGALFLFLIIVLLVNPLLRRISPYSAFSSRDLALILSMVLVASVVPGQGLLRTIPYSLASTPIRVREDPRFAQTVGEMNLRPSLFPEKLEYGGQTPASDAFMSELSPGECIPWSAWLSPVLTWGVFLAGCYLMMTGLALILFQQWRQNERLSFPLLAVHQSLIEEPSEGHCYAPLFRSKTFWIGVAGVFLLHLFAGWRLHEPEGVPAIPMHWSVRELFAEGPLRYLPGHIHTNRIYFIFLGVAFFMPSRIGFSIWFFVIVYAAYTVIGKYYFPPFQAPTINDHRFGGTLAMSLLVLWLGRAHWVHIVLSLFRPPGSEEDRRDRSALVMFLSGCLIAFLWLVWAGVQPGWALVFLLLGLLISLTITRLVAETGIPFMRIDMGHQLGFLRLFPAHWLTCATLFFSFFIVMVFPNGSRVSCTTMAAHGIGLNEKESPRYQSRLCWMLVGLIVVGLVIGWAASLTANYHFSVTLNGQERPLNTYAYGLSNRIFNTVQDLQDGRYAPPPYSQPFHIAVGFVVVVALQVACLTMPNWPIHPIGLIMVHTYYSNEAWVSIFLGWMLKILLLRYGGARAYRALRPLFLGLIIGEVIAGAFWNVVPAVLVLLAMPYQRVKIQPY